MQLQNESELRLFAARFNIIMNELPITLPIKLYRSGEEIYSTSTLLQVQAFLEGYAAAKGESSCVSTNGLK